MKKINLRKIFIGLVAMFVISTISIPTMIYGQKKVEPKAFPVKVKYIDAGKIIPNSIIYFAYWDEATSKLVEKTANTGNGQVVIFKVPFGEKGATYPFIVLLSKDDMETVKKKAGSGEIRAYRIPAGADCKFLELEMNKGGGSTNKGCSIQMWSM